MRVWLVVFLVTGPSLAAVNEQAEAKSRIPYTAQEVIDLAGAVPPEFAADALLRLVESGTIRGREAKIDLVRQAFRLAGGASFPRKYQYRYGPTDSRAGWLSYAYDLDLDTESLRCRSIQIALGIDAPLARELFAEAHPGLASAPRHRCRDALIYDPELAHRTIAEICNRAFTDRERAQGRHVELAATHMRTITSPVQVVPGARLLLALRLAPDEFSQLLNAYVGGVAKVVADDRAFLGGDGLLEAMGDLAARCRELSLASDPLVHALRAYIISNRASTRCADTTARNMKTSLRGAEASDIVGRFNSGAFRVPPYVVREVPPLSEEETRAAAIGEASENPEYWTSGRAKGLLSDVQELRFGATRPGRTRGEPVPLEIRRTPEWRVKLQTFLSGLESWKAEDEKSYIDYFHQKCVLYMALIDMVPGGIDRDQVLFRFAGFLTSSPLQHDQPVVWFRNAADLVKIVKRSAVSEAAQEQRHSRDVTWVWKEFGSAGSAILTLYSKLESITAKAP